MAVQWLRLCTSTAGGAGWIHGQGTKIPHAAQPKKKNGKEEKKKKKQMGLHINYVSNLLILISYHAKICFKTNNFRQKLL